MISCRFLGLLSGLLLSLAAQAGEETIRVCLDEDVPPFSLRRGETGSGIDPVLIGALENSMQRSFKPIWFEIEDDDEVIRARRINALLVADICQFVAGYPLLESELRAPPGTLTQLAEFDGMSRTQTRERFAFEPFVLGRPYQRMIWGIALAPQIDREISSLEQLAGLRVVSEADSLPAYVIHQAAAQTTGLQSIHINQGENPLSWLSGNRADAALIERHRFDYFIKENPHSGVHWAEYQLPFGVNFAWVGLARNQGLLDQISATILDWQESGQLAEIITAAGVTYIQAQEPQVALLAQIRRIAFPQSTD